MTTIKAELAALKADVERAGDYITDARMNISEAVQKISENNAKIREIESRLATEQNGKGPKVGDTYYYNNGESESHGTRWWNDGHDKNRLAQGNVYKTRSAAEQKAENERTIKALADAADFTPDWSDPMQAKYELSYDHKMGRLWFALTRVAQLSILPPFCTEAEGQAAVEKIGVESVQALFTGARDEIRVA